MGPQFLTAKPCTTEDAYKYLGVKEGMTSKVDIQKKRIAKTNVHCTPDKMASNRIPRKRLSFQTESSSLIKHLRASSKIQAF